MICSCGVGKAPAPASPRHAADCSIAQAMRFRCPDCHTRRVGDVIAHANHCKLKEFQP